MINPGITFDRFLGTFAPGALLIFGAFYLHRPFLIKHFPYIAGDPSETNAILSGEGRTLLFSVAAICIGVVLNQLSDIAVVAVVEGESGVNRPKRVYRVLARIFSRIFCFKPMQDPRRYIVTRYIESPRSDIFLKMMRAWAYTEHDMLKENGEPAIAHQHIVARLKSLSDHSRLMLKEMITPLDFAASLFMSCGSLFLVALVAPLTARSVAEDIVVHKPQVYVALIIATYLLALIACFNLRRRIKMFFCHSMTIGLHFYINQRSDHLSDEREAP
ncbi:MAG: hypothetical protein GY847_09725 [Proteobacteria bacterium]|nr:hypothetical protein [Pseudomonadota bacterium]